MVQTSSESFIPTQTPCSQFCVEPAASAVDASAVWHGNASVPGCIDLQTLQLLDAANWRAVEYRVAVIQSLRDQTAGQCVCQIGRQEVAYMKNGLCMKIARPCHRQNVFVESQTAIQHDTEHLDLVGHR